MGNSNWSYLQNPFDNVTKRNLKKMYLMATDHFDKLQQKANTEPAIQQMYASAKPFFDAFINQYRKGQTDKAIYQMYTARLEELLTQLSSTLIRKWDIQIQSNYDIVTPEYKALMPNGRALFHNGAYDLRINEVRGLADRLRAFPQLATLQADVEAFAQQMMQARSQQQGVESIEQTNIVDLENTRFQLAQAMHAIFGGLIQLYYKDISKVETFYELKYLKSATGNGADGLAGLQAVQEVTVPINGQIMLFENQLVEGDELTVTNLGNTGLIAYATMGNQAVASAQTTGIAPGQSTVITLGANQNTLVLVNESSISEAKAKVELIL